MIREGDSRFRHLEQKVGIFIAVALAGIAIAAMLFGNQKDFFTKTYNLRFTVDRGTGFNKGMSVKLSGFRIGRITSIALNDLAMVDVVAEIDRKYSKWIRSDSTVKLVKEGLVGDSIVEVSVGSLDTPELKENESLTYLKTKGLDELADDIAEKIKPVLNEVRDIIKYINDPEGDLKKTIHNLEVLTANLEETRQHADKLLVSTGSNIDRLSGRTTTVLESATRKIDSLDLTSSITRLNATLDQFNQRILPIMDKADNTLGNLNRISEKTEKTMDKALPQLPGILTQTEDVLFSTDRLINSVQNIWLFRDNNPARPDRSFIKGDSYE